MNFSRKCFSILVSTLFKSRFLLICYRLFVSTLSYYIFVVEADGAEGVFLDEGGCKLSTLVCRASLGDVSNMLFIDALRQRNSINDSAKSPGKF